jgi:hypothetical protein
VRAFEEKLVFMDISNKVIGGVYSPLLYWTKKKFKELEVQLDSKFNVWCAAYCAVRRPHDDESTQSMKTNELARRARESEMKGERKISWFELAREVSAEEKSK